MKTWLWGWGGSNIHIIKGSRQNTVAVSIFHQNTHSSPANILGAQGYEFVRTQNEVKVSLTTRVRSWWGHRAWKDRSFTLMADLSIKRGTLFSITTGIYTDISIKTPLSMVGYFHYNWVNGECRITLEPCAHPYIVPTGPAQASVKRD